MVDAVLATAQREGASLRYWSAWNEPNHPYGLSPQRPGRHPERAVAGGRRLRRADRGAAGRAGRGARRAGAGARRARRARRAQAADDACRRVPRPAPARHRLPRARVHPARRRRRASIPPARWPVRVRRFRCGRPFEIWMTETGVGAPGSGRTRSLAPAVQRRECRAASPPAPLVGRRSRHRRRSSPPCARTRSSRPGSSSPRCRRPIRRWASGRPGAAPGARPAIRRRRAPVDD